MRRIKRKRWCDGFMWLLPKDWLGRASADATMWPQLGNCKRQSLLVRGEHCPARNWPAGGTERKLEIPGCDGQEGEQSKMRSRRSQGPNHVWILFQILRKAFVVFQANLTHALRDHSDCQVNSEPQGNKSGSRETNERASLVAERDDISLV